MRMRMSSDAIPDADAREQADPLIDLEEWEGPRIGDETPEADAYEQSLPVSGDDEDDARR
jgi:hypothetical protein